MVVLTDCSRRVSLIFWRRSSSRWTMIPSWLVSRCAWLGKSSILLSHISRRQMSCWRARPFLLKRQRPRLRHSSRPFAKYCIAKYIGDGEPGITDLGITERGITESVITWEIGKGYNGTWYNGIRHNQNVESGITETGITESGITWKFDSGIRYNKKMESGITESGITESGITRKRNLV